MSNANLRKLGVLGTALAALIASSGALASSHMDAPLITLDDAANTTDVYAFVSEHDGRQYLTTALAVYPFEAPGIGPNAYQFDDNVRYEIHLAIGDDLEDGEDTISYRFEFDTEFNDRGTILQSFLPPGPVGVDPSADDFDEIYPGLNRVQTYRVRIKDRRRDEDRKRTLGYGVVPPNNQGRVTPF